MLDMELVTRVLGVGANVNISNVHNTMSASETSAELQTAVVTVRLVIENCSRGDRVGI